VLTKDERQVKNDDGDNNEIGLNHFQVEDMDIHARKWQAYLQDKE
jgi:hypothetical protein